MKMSNIRFLPVAFVFLPVITPLEAVAQDDCYHKIIDFAEGLCAEFVATDGTLSVEKYKGEINANLGKIIYRLAELEGNVDAELKSDEYENILREDVPLALEQGRQCRLEVARLFYGDICSAGLGSDPGEFSKLAVLNNPTEMIVVRNGNHTLSENQTVGILRDSRLFTITYHSDHNHMISWRFADTETMTMNDGDARQGEFIQIDEECIASIFEVTDDDVSFGLKCND